MVATAGDIPHVVHEEDDRFIEPRDLPESRKFQKTFRGPVYVNDVGFSPRRGRARLLPNTGYEKEPIWFIRMAGKVLLYLVIDPCNQSRFLPIVTTPGKALWELCSVTMLVLPPLKV